MRRAAQQEHYVTFRSGPGFYSRIYGIYTARETSEHARGDEDCPEALCDVHTGRLSTTKSDRHWTDKSFCRSDMSSRQIGVKTVAAFSTSLFTATDMSAGVFSLVSD